MLSINPFNVVCNIINILLLVWLMKKFLFDRVHKIIAARQAEAEAALNEANAKAAEAEETKAKYIEYTEKLEEDKAQMLSDARQEANAEYQKIVDEAGLQAKEIVENARTDAELERSKMMSEVKADLADMVVSAAGKLVGTSDVKNQNADLYDQFLSKAGENLGE